MEEAWFAERRGRGVLDFREGADLFRALGSGGNWLVVADFEGRVRGWRMKEVADVSFEEASAPLPSEPAQQPSAHPLRAPWNGPRADSWSSSLDQREYTSAVSASRDYIAEGTVYQANICRVMSAPLPSPGHPAALTRILAMHNPAPHLGYALIEHPDPSRSLWIASASPELYLQVEPHENGATISSRPIKGTGRRRSDLTEKDEAENVMITDLVRNDISPLCTPGTVAVRDFLKVEEHPGLFHLVSTVEGEIPLERARSSRIWEEIFAATYPPGSVSGAPKSSALRIISALETHPRGPYCGAIGWIDADRMSAILSVGIRTFWWETGCCERGSLHFGTGAGITWGSDPQREWEETQLKAERLVALASQGGAA